LPGSSNSREFRTNWFRTFLKSLTRRSRVKVPSRLYSRRRITPYPSNTAFNPSTASGLTSEAKSPGSWPL
jgi:hypothetical protein